jgi:hypothetical protein
MTWNGLDDLGGRRVSHVVGRGLVYTAAPGTNGMEEIIVETRG